MILIKHLCFFALFVGLTYANKVRYDGYKLVKVFPTKEEHITLLDEWEDDPSFDVWNRIRGINHGVDVALSPKAYENFKVLFEYNGMPYTVINHNIQDLSDEEERSMVKNRLENGYKVAGRYVSHAEINTWLEMIATANPSFLTTSNIGTTQGNRILKTIIFRKGNPSRKIWYDCGIHAREWISPSTCTYVIEKLVTLANSNNPEINSILSKFELHFLPVHNPDGYEYSRTNSRLWRKNRATTSSILCPGVDLNRNYGNNWMVAGASSSACSDTYAGPLANSEPEVKAVQSVINSALGQWAAFITIHSYGQWFLTPWGWTNALPADYTAQLALARSTSDAIKGPHNTQFTSGSTSGLLYLAAGNSADWAYGNAGIKYSYTIELRPGDNTPDASYGFQLPEDRAPFVGEEIYRGLIHLMSNV